MTPADLIDRLGQPLSSAGLEALVEMMRLVDRYDDPPGRSYIGDDARGFCLLIEDDRLIDLQFYIQARDDYQAYREGLPFGLAAGLDQAAVEKLIGAPAKFGETFSLHRLEEPEVRVMIEYDRQGLVRYMSISPSALWPG